MTGTPAKDNTAAGAEVGPRTVPTAEVDPTNELLDGDDTPTPDDLAKSDTVIDPSGTRLEHVDNDQIPPPQSANLELVKRLDKEEAALYGSVGATREGDPEPEDDMVRALREERRGLQGRADDGDDKAKRRLTQVDEQLRARGAKADDSSDTSDDKASAAQQRKAAAAGDSSATRRAPAGRSSKPTKSTGTTAAK